MTEVARRLAPLLLIAFPAAWACGDSDPAGPVPSGADLRGSWVTQVGVTLTPGVIPAPVHCEDGHWVGTLEVTSQGGDAFEGTVDLAFEGSSAECAEALGLQEPVRGTIRVEAEFTRVALVLGSRDRMGEILEAVTGCSVTSPVGEFVGFGVDVEGTGDWFIALMSQGDVECPAGPVRRAHSADLHMLIASGFSGRLIPPPAEARFP